ncbi:MAG TPA: efflux RND transporter periplasmic adaptor subunit [Verrucomicrobiae bacterium]
MAKSKAARAVKWLVTLAVLGGAGFYGWRYWDKQNEDKARPQFTTAKIERGDLVQMVTASGTLNPVVNVQVGSQISGQIKKLNADFNSKVKAGDLVAQIDPATYQTRLLQNEADLASAKAARQLAEVNARRAEQLVREKLISQSDFDTAEANLEQAKAQVLQRQAQVDSTKVDLARCDIFAPIDGIVIDRKVDVGQTVAASLNAPVLFQIANDLAKMQIDANVAEADIGNVVTNQDTKFTVDAFPGRDFMGKVVQVRNAPQTVQNVVSYDTIIEVDNSDLKLKPGMTANVQIITSKKEGAVRIPNSALRFRPPAGAVPASSVGGGALTSAGEAVPQTPEAMIVKVKELREKGEQLGEQMRAKFREMMQAGVIKPEQLGLSSTEGSGGGRTSSGGSGGPRMSSGGGGGKKGGGGGGGSRRAVDRPATRTIYVVDSSLNSTNVTVADLKPLVIKTGITDGIYTEVLDGLKDGDVIVTGQVIAQSASQRPTNPFGGSSFGRGPR